MPAPDLASLLLADIPDGRPGSLEKAKRRWAKTLGHVPASRDILAAYLFLRHRKQIDANALLEKSLQIKKQRTRSGVVPFAVMMKADPCPGRCTYCIQEPGLPKSYMTDEPSAQRALRLNFDPKLQVLERLAHLTALGHQPQKLQIIVIGGTFSSYPDSYKRDFLKSIFDACNGIESPTIAEAHRLNETAKHRVVGLSVETRPDWITQKEIALLREYGVTKVQLGVQSLNEEVNERTRRGHNIEAVRHATRDLRNAGFKISYHMMPNLPGSTPEQDVGQVRQLFEDEDFRPDTLKLYSAIVLPKTPLWVEWKNGAYKSYDDETLVDVLVRSKALVPSYCRLDRVVRDITRLYTASGTLKTNLRELVQKRMQVLNLKCRCIRCREIGDHVGSDESPSLRQVRYSANGGTELFISFENSQHLFGMIRLRLPAKPSDTAMIRELQVFGVQLPFVDHLETATQHKSLGKQLMAMAEAEAQKAGYKKLAVISGVGVRGYYRQLGYELEGTYMTKALVPQELRARQAEPGLAPQPLA